MKVPHIRQFFSPPRNPPPSTKLNRRVEATCRAGNRSPARDNRKSHKEEARAKREKEGVISLPGGQAPMCEHSPWVVSWAGRCARTRWPSSASRCRSRSRRRTRRSCSSAPSRNCPRDLCTDVYAYT